MATLDSRSAPTLERFRHVGKHLAAERAVVVSASPDLALERLERSCLPIAIHQPRRVPDDAGDSLLAIAILPVRRRLTPRDIFDPLLAQAAKRLPQSGLVEMLADMRRERPARKREQDVVDELDPGGRALDVEDDLLDAAAGQLERHAPATGWVPGKYAGPKHTGWKPASTPLPV